MGLYLLTFEHDRNLTWKPTTLARIHLVYVVHAKKKILTPIPPNKMNNEDTNVIPISGALKSALISGIPGNYYKFV